MKHGSFLRSSGQEFQFELSESELVIKDYEKNPSELSGSKINIHINSPILKGTGEYTIGQEDDGEYWYKGK